MRLSRIWKLYLLFTAVLLVTMTLAGFVLQDQLKKALQNRLLDQVLTLSRLVVKVLPEARTPAVLDPFCREYQKAAGVRITLIQTDGRVIGESERASIRVENHLVRPEVQAALKQGRGTAVRQSDTLGIDMLYLAVHLKDKNLILRLGIPMSEVKKIQNNVMIFLTLALYLTPLFAIVVSFFFARYMSASGESRDD